MEKKLTDEEIVKALENGRKGYGTGVVGDLFGATLDFIHRLQDENERLTREVDKQKNFVIAWEESWKIANEQNTKIRVKIKKENAKLKKKVDELTDKLGKVLSGIKADELLVAKGIEQSVKDTAKEILGFILAKEFEKGDYLTDDELKKAITERYGVEIKE